MAYRHIDVTPVTGALGAVIAGADLTKPLPKPVFAEIKKAWLDHQVIFFRDQDLSPDAQVRFAKRFGAIHTHPFMKTMEGHPEILEIVKLESDKRNFGNHWHTDQIFMARPAKATMLYAVEVPEPGGDTLFADLYAAYDTLSPGMKRLAGKIDTVSTSNHNRPERGVPGPDRFKQHTMRPQEAPKDLKTTNTHPLVRTHPETGRKSLYVSWQTIGLDRIDEDEAAPLLAFWRKHIQKPELTCRFRWQPGSLALWDNRCVQHYAVDDYPGQRRVMRRITIKGDKPR